MTALQGEAAREALQHALPSLLQIVKKAVRSNRRAGAGEHRSVRQPDLEVTVLDEHGEPVRLLIEVKVPQKFSDVPSRQYEAEFIAVLTEALSERLGALNASGRDLRELGSPDDLARLLVERMPLTPSPLEDLVGPFYDTPSLSRWLDVSRQVLDARVRAKSLLGLPVGSGPRVYPAWQFDDDGGPVPSLSTVLKVLANGTPDPWTWALWLSAPDADYEGLAAWQWLKERRDPEPILAEARADAARWAA